MTGFKRFTKLKRGVLCAKIATYPDVTGESGFEDREIVSSTRPQYLLISLHRFHFVVLMIKHGVYNELDVVEPDTRKQ